MKYVNYYKGLQEIEKSMYERELRNSKQLLESYEDFKEVIVPAMKQYINISVNKEFKRTAQGVLIMCEIGEAQLKSVLNDTRKVTLCELKTMNKNFSMSMELIQKKYEHIVTEEIQQFNDDEFNI